jgi:hypothetical protein
MCATVPALDGGAFHLLPAESDNQTAGIAISPLYRADGRQRIE